MATLLVVVMLAACETSAPKYPGPGTPPLELHVVGDVHGYLGPLGQVKAQV